MQTLNDNIVDRLMAVKLQNSKIKILSFDNYYFLEYKFEMDEFDSILLNFLKNHKQYKLAKTIKNAHASYKTRYGNRLDAYLIEYEDLNNSSCLATFAVDEPKEKQLIIEFKKYFSSLLKIDQKHFHISNNSFFKFFESITFDINVNGKIESLIYLEVKL